MYSMELPHIAPLVYLLWIPVAVALVRKGDKFSYVSPVARLFERWTRPDRRVAWVCMLARVWLISAAWNAAMVQFLKDGNWNFLLLKAAALAVVM